MADAERAAETSPRDYGPAWPPGRNCDWTGWGKETAGSVIGNRESGIAYTAPVGVPGGRPHTLPGSSRAAPVMRGSHPAVSALPRHRRSDRPATQGHTRRARLR